MSMPPPPAQPPGQPHDQPPGQPQFHPYPPPVGGGTPGAPGAPGSPGIPPVPPGSGGFGPPGSGGWQPPPPPGGGRRTVLAIVVAAVVAVALIAGAVLLLTGGDDEDTADDAPSSSAPPSPATPEPTGSTSEEPEDFPGDEPEEDPSDSARPDFEELMPTPSEGPIPSYQMEVGDCFDIPAARNGHGEPTDCGSAHDAEVVHQEKLTEDYDTDADVRKAADSLCRTPMKDEAAGHSEVGGTLVQFPKASGMKLGMRTVTCSLTAGDGKKLHEGIT